jgi:hypothetical protein
MLGSIIGDIVGSIYEFHNMTKKFIIVSLVLLFVGMVLSSCHEQLDFGVVWDEQAAKTQMTKDSLKLELEWYGDDAFMTAIVKDKNGDTLAFISRQSGDDICTVIKYLRNDTGLVRGFLVYPGCYPVAERTGNAKIKEEALNELEKYKEMLWDDFGKGNHPNDIGLALVMDEREDRPYAARYYFRYDKVYTDQIRAIYDPITKQLIKSDDEFFRYDVSTKTREVSGDSLIGDVHLMFVDISNIEFGTHTYKTYCGYRPMEEFEFMSHRMFKHTVFRSDCPEPYVTVEFDWDDDGTRYKISRDYEDHAIATTYSDGIIKKVEEVSQWGTVLKQDIYEDTGDDETYICRLMRYNYQAKKLEEAGMKRVNKVLHHMESSESGEMILDEYLYEMWGRYADDNYWDSFMDEENE